MEGIEKDKIVKIGIIVQDVEKAAQYYSDIFKIEKPAIRVSNPDAVPAFKNFYKGEYRTGGIAKVAIIPLEPIMIELIEPTDQISPWNDFKQEHGQGVHYIALNIDGFHEHIDFLEKKGIGVIQQTDKGHERYAYFDTVDQLGVTLELKEIDNV
jgi:methylmalonyl-CoA/ethylmalonyl-CoA epimerase